ncbi:ATP-dependent DNA ligase I [Nitzschia inconspicua]|uniref:DNA ligase (ATP) n=1 Tax=Nitzschia inconspicua TaxID=303405 RepID=A0A9K3KZ56_9STRA|nr:ATP-dependent DNA ligase I [Nitzschia inconspicua]
MKRNIQDEREKIQRLRGILGNDISSERLKQVLEASNGSLEHSIEIFFHQNEHQKQQEDHPPMDFVGRFFVSPCDNFAACRHTPNGAKRSPEKMAVAQKVGRKSQVTKQPRLESFFSVRGNSKDVWKKDIQLGLVGQNDNEKCVSGHCEEDESVKILDESVKVKESLLHDDDAATSSEKKASLPRTIKSLPEIESLTSRPGDVSFERLAEMLQQLADSPKRTTKLNLLQAFIREIIDVDGVEMSSRARTLTSALELILGGKTSKPMDVSGLSVSKALQLSLGVSRSQMSNAYRQFGDLGDCAANFFQRKNFFVTPAVRHLSIVQVASGMQKICVTNGRDAKQHMVLDLLRRCQSKTEIRFLVRLLISSMRVGANLKTVLAALAMAITSMTNNVTPQNKNDGVTKTDVKEAIAMVQRAHDLCPSIEKIVSALLEGGLEQMLQDCSIQVHIPIAPMLAHPVHAIDEVEKAMETLSDGAVMEFKYDGMRLQAHYDGRSIKLFSRHMLETTNQFPEVATYLLESFQTNVEGKDPSFIIDAEVVGVEWEGAEMRLLPFQDILTRKKKNDDPRRVRVKVFAFDLMFLNGNSLINEPFSTRRHRLKECFRETKDFAFVESLYLPKFDKEGITAYLRHSIDCGAEGLVIKMFARDATYDAGTRSRSWLKVKRDYVGGFADTIDVVPIGAWYGNGRKAQKSFLSPVLLAVYDDQEDVFRSISRCMTFTDSMYRSMREFYFRGTPYADERGTTTDLEEIKEEQSWKTEESSEPLCKEVRDDSENGDDDRVNCFPSRPSSAVVVTHESPHIWFKPLEVFEVSFADLSLSRQHTAAAGLVDEEGSGVALRFPRFKRRRPDKKPEQATTSVQIAQLFSMQTKIKRANH